MMIWVHYLVPCESSSPPIWGNRPKSVLVDGRAVVSWERVPLQAACHATATLDALKYATGEKSAVTCPNCLRSDAMREVVAQAESQRLQPDCPGCP